ncbi:MAG: phosphoribosylanthranilate isomerase [Anaerolineaceae bacterium]|nr:phosphoribosylanthranilate isomerase [Anaerolineaceae bacterium]
MIKIKICGIRTLEEALAVIEAGADILGFNFYPSSPRYIKPGDAMRLTVRLETALREEMARISLVGVFVNAEPNYIHAVFRDCHLDNIQLSGDEPPEALEALGERAFKVLRPTTEEELFDAVNRYPRRTLAPAWLIDTYHPGLYGGTGEPVDWNLACTLAKQAPIILAGGLRADNVAAALRQVHPWGVDVASGVESAPGVKDLQKVAAFVQAVRSFAEEPA